MDFFESFLFTPNFFGKIFIFQSGLILGNIGFMRPIRLWTPWSGRDTVSPAQYIVGVDN